MNTDRYTKIALTLIALGVWATLLRPVGQPGQALAQTGNKDSINATARFKYSTTIPQGQGVPLRSTPAASVATGVTTIVIVRHGEKAADDPRDPTLSVAGQNRAVALATSLDSAEVGAIYSTQFKRTRATVEPLAKRFNVPVTVRPISAGDVATYATQLARDVLAKDAGKTVAIVGHSNTVPELVKAFSGRIIQPLTDEDYDHLYIVVVPSTGAARLLQTRYGAPHTAPGP